jgi:MFS family permease
MSIIPILLVDGIGINMFLYGIIEGVCEFLSSILKLFSGKLYDRINQTKYLFIITIIFAFFSKIFLYFPTATSMLFSKTSERIANGIFGTPRDTYVLDNVVRKGIFFSLLSCSKTLGCIISPICIGLICHYYGGLDNNINLFLSFCVSITAVCFVLTFFIKNRTIVEVEHQTESLTLKHIFKNKHLFKIYLLSMLFFLARFNDGLLIIHLKNMNYPSWLYLGTIGYFNAAMFTISPLFGLFIDKKKLKLVGYLTIVSLLLFNIVFYNLNILNFEFVFLGLIFWGIQRTGAQLFFTNLVYNSVDKHNKGFAIGVFSFISGLSLFISSSFCGYLADFNLNYAFMVSGFFSLLSLIILKFYIKDAKRT